LAEPKATKEKRDQTKEKSGKDSPKTLPAKPNDKSNDKSHLARRPDHEQPSKFPDGLKRPDLNATVDGNKIASEAQRQLFDDVKRGNCTRCHKGGHNRKDCKEPKAKWEEKFDKEKLLYWTSVHKWQQRASQPADKPVTSKDPPKPPTLHVKPEQRFAAMAYDSSSEDEYAPLVHYRMTMPDPYSDDDDDEDTPLTVDDDVAVFSPPLTVSLPTIPRTMPVTTLR
jgi:hypothetical protein